MGKCAGRHEYVSQGDYETQCEGVNQGMWVFAGSVLKGMDWNVTKWENSRRTSESVSAWTHQIDGRSNVYTNYPNNSWIKEKKIKKKQKSNDYLIHHDKQYLNISSIKSVYESNEMYSPVYHFLKSDIMEMTPPLSSKENNTIKNA